MRMYAIHSASAFWLHLHTDNVFRVNGICIDESTNNMQMYSDFILMHKQSMVEPFLPFAYSIFMDFEPIGQPIPIMK